MTQTGVMSCVSQTKVSLSAASRPQVARCSQVAPNRKRVVSASFLDKSSPFESCGRHGVLGRSHVSVQRVGRQARPVVCGLFGLGVPEIAVIAAVAAVLFGPKQLPEIGKSLGKTVKSFQQAAKEFESEVKSGMDSATDAASETLEKTVEKVKEEKEKL